MYVHVFRSFDATPLGHAKLGFLQFSAVATRWAALADLMWQSTWRAKTPCSCRGQTTGPRSFSILSVHDSGLIKRGVFTANKLRLPFLNRYLPQQPNVSARPGHVGGAIGDRRRGLPCLRNVMELSRRGFAFKAPSCF